MLQVTGCTEIGAGAFDAAAAQVLVRDHNGTPVVLVLEHAGVVLVWTPRDDDFEAACRAAGYCVETRDVHRT